MSRCAGAGREHGQADSPGWPMEIFHTTDMHSLGVGVGWEQEAIFFFLFCDFKSSFCWEFTLFQQLCKIHKNV